MYIFFHKSSIDKSSIKLISTPEASHPSVLDLKSKITLNNIPLANNLTRKESFLNPLYIKSPYWRSIHIICRHILIYHCPIFILYFLFLFSYFYSQTNAAKTSVFMNKIIIFITKKFFDIACWIDIFSDLVDNLNKEKSLVYLQFLLYEFIINNACGAALIFWFFIIFPIFYIFIIKLTIIQFNNWFSFVLLFFNFLIFFIGLLGIVGLIIAQFCKKDFNSIKDQGIQFLNSIKDEEIQFEDEEIQSEDEEIQLTKQNEDSAKKKKKFFFDNIHSIFIKEKFKDKISYNYITHIQTELWQASFSNFFKKAYSIVGGDMKPDILPNITLILFF